MLVNKNIKKTPQAGSKDMLLDQKIYPKQLLSLLLLFFEKFCLLPTYYPFKV
jgi:hypothetical protein